MSEAERSSKKPNVPGMSTEEPQQRKFNYSTEAYDSYVKEGLTPPEPWKRPDKFELKFLSAVDLTKGKIKIEITRMIRLKAQDFSSDKREYKEYLVWESNWFAKNWLDVETSPVSHIEGKYSQQTLRLINSPPDPKTGQSTAYYEKGVPRTVHTIPFNKATVDKLLKGEHPFGPDSVNITDPDKVVFYGKFENILGVQSFRCADFTYEQFTVPEWKQFSELAIQEGRPARRKYIEDRPQFIA